MLDVVARLDELDAIARLASACNSRLTTPQRLIEALADRPRMRRRRWVHAVRTDLAEGTASVLEQGYLTLVERAHGLPHGIRNAAQPGARPGTTAYRNVQYLNFELDVELDGRMWHDGVAAHDADLERDLVAATRGRRTVRLGWGQVLRRSCVTAGRIAGLLHLGGWRDQPRPCGPACGIEQARRAG